MDLDQILENLTKNGLDFLERAASELPTAPKYSVIHFASGLEILLKARLLSEHWTLTLAKPESADLDKFKAGDFQSVRADEVLGRIERVTAEQFAERERTAFRDINRHRNRIVHFYHDRYNVRSGSPELTGIVTEQTRAWFYLQRLLTERWAHMFGGFEGRIREIDAAFRHNREYLQVRFDNLSSSIAKERFEGARITSCPVCGYNAFPERSDGGVVREGQCVVCESFRIWLEIECPHCKKTVPFDDITGTSCEECEKPIDMEHLFAMGGAFEQTDGSTEGVAYCLSCEYTPEKSVVAYSDQFLCLACFSTYPTTGQCGYCGEDVAPQGHEAETHLHGCVICEGTWATHQYE